VITGNVLALGAVSLITDISTEMVSAVLPAYLVLGLGLSIIQYGTLDGFYTGATALTRLLGGYVADRFRARKAVAGVGYGLGALAKLALLGAGPSPAGIGGSLGIDRVGKGLRTAPRDALITLSVPPDALGRAFGVHRMMDSIGAFLGPLVALAVLAATAQAYDAVFVVSFCVALLGVLVLVLFVRDRRAATPGARRGGQQRGEGQRGGGQAGGGAHGRPPLLAAGPAAAKRGTVAEAFGLLRGRQFRQVAMAAALLGLITIGDGFVYLLIQRRDNLPALWFPLLAVGTNLSYLTLAAPLGALADRVGRWRVVLSGYAALLGTYLLLAGGWGGWPALLLTVGLYGAFYAATDGVLMAAAGPLLPAHLRTTGLALVQTGQALAYVVSSIGFGFAWQWWGPGAAAAVAAAGVVTAVPLAARWLRPRTAG
jgi:MFS family permease